MHYKAMSRGRRTVCTFPIKALVNEKFLALCQDFGPENVGLATGDATVNRDAPILCCTAEILAQSALSEGADSPFVDVVMDEFHYYSDRDRGWAWQVPLLILKKARFLLMSATLGATRFFEECLTNLTGIETSIISSMQRPVPLEFSYADTSLDETLMDLLAEQRAPVYVVHFTQNEAAQSAQDLTSLPIISSAEKAALAEALAGEKFSSPYGKDLKRYLRHGIGVHHAGLLPRYRLLVEKLAQQGLLKVICGTDTLGVGVNVPIRTVLLTRLSKYSGEKVALLTARDFHQITGRAGRRGFDDKGWVVCLPPEHVIENKKAERKAGGDPRKMKKFVRRQPPPGFVGWSEETFTKLVSAAPEPLVSRFAVTPGMLLQVLGQPGDGCRAMQRLIAATHEPDKAKKKHRERAWQLFRALAEKKIVQVIPRQYRGDGAKIRLHIDLQADFSLNWTLSLWIVDAVKLIDPQSPNYAVDVLSLAEAIVEDPDLILRRQLDRVKNRRMAQMKSEGLSYEQRMDELEQLEYPKPCRDFIYRSFNDFAEEHPWVAGENIRPKSIVREMYENFRSFSDYVHDYDLQRSEGLLLRHLSAVAKVLDQTVPVAYKTEGVQEIEAWLTGVLRSVDSSLLDEWERMRNPDFIAVERTEPRPPVPQDITKRTREFTALIRSAIFRFLQPFAQGRTEDAIKALADAGEEGKPPRWTVDQLEALIAPFFDDHSAILLTPAARNINHTHIRLTDDREEWTVHQVLVDPEELNDWQLEFSVNLARSRAEDRPVMVLKGLGPISR